MEVVMKETVLVRGTRTTNALYKIIAVMALSLVAVLGLGVSGASEARADSTNNVVDLGKNNATLNAMAGQINKSSGANILKYSTSTGILSFNSKLYSDFTTVEKREYMSDTLGYVKRSKLNDRVKNKMFNFVADQDTTSSAAIRNLKVDAQTDLASAAAILQPFTGTISIVLGLISILVVMLLGIGTVLDIAYIALPMARTFYSKDDNVKPMLLSQEAYASVVDGENSIGTGSYTSAIGLYIRRRVIVLICVGLAILYLVTGQIFDIIGFFVDMMAPAIEQSP